MASPPPPSYSFPRTLFIFRYVGDQERAFIVNNGVIYSYNPQGTYWTTYLTNDPALAQKKLSLKKPPKHRVGGLQLKDIDINLISRKGVVAPAFEQPGGADEILIQGPIPILSIFDLNTRSVSLGILK